MEEEEKPRILQVAGKLCGWTVRETLQHPDELNSAAGNVAVLCWLDLLSGHHSVSLSSSGTGPEALIKMHLYFACCLSYFCVVFPFFSKVKMMELQSPETK